MALLKSEYIKEDEDIFDLIPVKTNVSWHPYSNRVNIKKYKSYRVGQMVYLEAECTVTKTTAYSWWAIESDIKYYNSFPSTTHLQTNCIIVYNVTKGAIYEGRLEGENGEGLAITPIGIFNASLNDELVMIGTFYIDPSWS